MRLWIGTGVDLSGNTHHARPHSPNEIETKALTLCRF